jgi:CHAT domain-containing protein
VLEYFVGPKVFVVVARKDTSCLVSLDATESEVNSVVDVYRRVVQRGGKSPEDDLWKGSAYKLYSMLIAPLVTRGLIFNGDHLLISPHRVLHLFPFHALTVTAKDTQPTFLVEQYCISYIPSASFLVEQRKHSVTPIYSMLAIAPDDKSLPFSEDEIEKIPRTLFPYLKVMKNAEANADQILRHWEHYDAVHFATHAKMNLRFPLYSTIQCADRGLQLHEILRQKMRARLVVLSACETGLGVGALRDVPTSDDLVSFPRAFMTAGVTSVVASLWLVEDAATAALMKKFYRNIAFFRTSQDTSRMTLPTSSADKLACALTFAQRQFLTEARASGKKTHPFFWASFFLLGDGR